MTNEEKLRIADLRSTGMSFATEESKEHFMKVIHLLLKEKAALIENFAEIKDTVFDTSFQQLL